MTAKCQQCADLEALLMQYIDLLGPTDEVQRYYGGKALPVARPPSPEHGRRAADEGATPDD